MIVPEEAALTSRLVDVHSERLIENSIEHLQHRDRVLTLDGAERPHDLLSRVTCSQALSGDRREAVERIMVHVERDQHLLIRRSNILWHLCSIAGSHQRRSRRWSGSHRRGVTVQPG